MTSPDARLAASFRDPSGFLFRRDGVLYRQVNRAYKEDYDLLMESGLYGALVNSRLLVPHEEVGIELALTEDAYKVLRPKPIPFVSYPYEWCFSQLRDAALATLAVQKAAFEHGMVLKDSSAYNIQWLRGRPVLIDTLSLRRYREGEPWVAYRQFCQHFLAPLALMAYCDVRLSQLLRIHIDGIPLDMASSFLPWHTRLRFGLLSHVHLHARAQARYAGKRVEMGGRRMGRLGFRGLIDSLEGTVRKLHWRPGRTVWADYYGETNYSPEAFAHKRQLVAEFLTAARPQNVWDLGANTALFSRIASCMGVPTVAFDVDPACVERIYRDGVQAGEQLLLPLVLDLTNPSPDLGWANRERASLLRRGPADVLMALALVHHLAIGNNVPLEDVAELFARMCSSLIVEFVPKSDSQVQRMLSSREDVFPDYQREGFEAAFGAHFRITRSEALRGSERRLYAMEVAAP